MTEQMTLTAKYSKSVPRYTSYPTAPHFHEGVKGEQYRQWLQTIPKDEAISLYFHIPFCDTLCWFCGCHTKITQRYEPVQRYLTYLKREIELVAAQFTHKQPVRHIHWGGGSPTILEPCDILDLSNHIHKYFDVNAETEFAIEIDPRGMSFETIRALTDAGINRASLGIQDVTEKVQKAINRVQPMDETKAVIASLHEEGITRINLDLIYGLPFQTEESIRANIDAVKELNPSRIALFGYAHVPWMKTHMRMIRDEDLPNQNERIKQSQLAAKLLNELGYVSIGLDHFARPDDPLAIAALENRLTRNFQGYTDDEAETLIGLGVSSIGVSENGYVQNHLDMRSYVRAIENDELPIKKGKETSLEDRIHRTIIMHLMCRHVLDLDEISQIHNVNYTLPADIHAKIADFAKDGLVQLIEGKIVITEVGKPLVRIIASIFDRYLDTGIGKHSQAI